MPLPDGTHVAYGDIILLIGKDLRQFIRTVKEGQRFECHLGYIEYDALVGAAYGSQFPTHKGHKMFVLIPHTEDIILHLQRLGQIIYPKDLGYIALKLGIRPGVRVIEAGTGSGALTMTLAMLVGDEGHVYTYERRNDMLSRAFANLRRMDLLDRVTFHEKDIEEGFEETDVHALFLDVREPADYLPQARAALRGGGFFGALVPTMNQVLDLAQPLYDGPWYMLQIEELLLRSYKTHPQRVRPDDQMVGHTGYLIFARAVDRDTRTASTNEAPDDMGDDTRDIVRDDDPGDGDQ
ncbi:MAG TPA: tRNA (adenine-N1)-methyltransferase [Aggregatilinea sp.]|uniref:tRNA (adenine-N1)-methyltransferase n=1 Tax=Aggregatilinea sp. TaxID=2806333 RepID=UPI002BCA1598|nr:tRNA (adenine-N1)-methyltransferase [Aggregatilinea sp.]HML24713.1 tRNA (adenine-N1)-methyltransferase [Aggregatilinea sp.]